MIAFLWLEDNKSVSDSFGAIELDTKPVLGFNWSEIKYLPLEKTYTKTAGGRWLPLTADQIASIEAFVEQKRTEVGPNVSAVDANGYFLGSVTRTHPDFFRQVEPPPSADDTLCYDFSEDLWKTKYFFDAAGKQTFKADSVGGTFVQPNSRLDCWNALEQRWELSADDLNHLKEVAIFDSIRVLICGTVKYIYSQNLDGKNLNVFDFLTKLSQLVGVEMHKWLSDKQLLDTDLAQLQSAFAIQNNALNVILSTRSREEIELEVQNIINQIYSIQLNGCRNRISPLEYPERCTQ